MSERIPCIFLDCGSPRYVRGYCIRHYRRLMRGVPMEPLSIPERFWLRVDQDSTPDACWEWQRGRVRGYGAMKIDNRTYKAHRMAWMFTHGPIPEGLFVCHHCDNPPCCRPDHLFLGTPADNSADMKRKGRRLGRNSGVGEAAPNAVLSEAIVRAIRASYASGVMQRDLASRYGVTKSNISLIVHRQTWKHIP